MFPFCSHWKVTHKCMLISTSPSRWYTSVLSFCTGKTISSLNLCDLQLTDSGSYSSLDFWPLFIIMYMEFQPAITNAVFYKMQSHVAAQPLRKAVKKRGRAPKGEKTDRTLMFTLCSPQTRGKRCTAWHSELLKNCSAENQQ